MAELRQTNSKVTDTQLRSLVARCALPAERQPRAYGLRFRSALTDTRAAARPRERDDAVSRRARGLSVGVRGGP